MADYLEKLKSEYPGVFGPVAASDYTTLAGMGDSVDYILDYWKDKGKEGVKFLKDFAFEHMTSPDIKGYIERSKERGEDLEKKRDEFSDALKGYMDRSEKDALEKAKEYRDGKLKIGFSTGEDPSASYDIATEAWKEAVREDPSGIAVMPSPLDSDYTKFRDGRILPFLDMPMLRPDDMTDDEIDELIEDELDLSKDDPLLSGYTSEDVPEIPAAVSIAAPASKTYGTWPDGGPLYDGSADEMELMAYSIIKDPSPAVEKRVAELKGRMAAKGDPRFATLDERLDVPDEVDISALMDRVVDLPIAEEVVLDADYYSKHGTPLAETKEEASATYPSWIADELATAIESDIGTVVTPMMIGEVLRKGEEPTALSIAEALAIPITSVGAGIIKAISRYRKIKDDLIGEPFDLSKSESLRDASSETKRFIGDDAAVLHDVYAAGGIVPDFAVSSSKLKRTPILGDVLKAIDARLATPGGTGATIDADKVIADTARSLLGDDSATSIAKIRDIMKAELIKDHPGIGKVGALETYIHGLPKSRMGGRAPSDYPREVSMDDLLSGYLPEEAATIGGYVEPAIRKAADAATIAKYGSIPDAMKSGAVTGAIGTAAFHGDDFLESFIPTALPAEAPIIPVDDFSSMPIPPRTALFDAGPAYAPDPRSPSLSYDFSGFGDPKIKWYWPDGRVDVITEEMVKEGWEKYTPAAKAARKAREEKEDAVAEALERMASLPPGSVGGPPITWTHIDATGSASPSMFTGSEGVGDIVGGSGTFTSPLGGYYIPHSPHTGLIPPPAYVDPGLGEGMGGLGDLWT